MGIHDKATQPCWLLAFMSALPLTQPREVLGLMPSHLGRLSRPTLDIDATPNLLVDEVGHGRAKLLGCPDGCLLHLCQLGKVFKRALPLDLGAGCCKPVGWYVLGPRHLGE